MIMLAMQKCDDPTLYAFRSNTMLGLHWIRLD